MLFVEGSDHVERFREFRTRYGRHGARAVTDLEAAEWHQQVAGVVDGDTYQQAATDTLGRLSETDRRGFAEAMAPLTHGYDVSAVWDGAATEPGALAGALRLIHEHGPSLAELLSGTPGPGAAPGGETGTTPARAVLAGIAALAGDSILTRRDVAEGQP